MASVTFGFIDPSGNNWTNGYSYNNIAVAQVVTAQAQINPDATQVVISWEYGVSATLFSFGNLSPNGVSLSIGGTTSKLYTLSEAVFGGCSDPFAPNNASGSYTLSSSELASAVSSGFIQIAMWGCPGSGTENYRCKAYTTQTVSSQDLYQTVSVTVENPVATPIANVPVILESAGGQTYTQNADSSGVATFSQVQVGSYQIKVTYNPFANVDQGITVASGQNQFTVQMQCPSGGQYQLGVCVASGISGQIVTALEIGAIAVGGVVLTYGVAKTLPKTIPYARSGYEKVKRLPSYVRQRLHR